MSPWRAEAGRLLPVRIRPPQSRYAWLVLERAERPMSWQELASVHSGFHSLDMDIRARYPRREAFLAAEGKDAPCCPGSVRAARSQLQSQDHRTPRGAAAAASTSARDSRSGIR